MIEQDILGRGNGKALHQHPRMFCLHKAWRRGRDAKMRKQKEMSLVVLLSPMSWEDPGEGCSYPNSVKKQDNSQTTN